MPLSKNTAARAGLLVSAFVLAGALTLPESADANGPGMIIPGAMVIRNQNLEAGLNRYIAAQDPQALAQAVNNGLSPALAPYAAQCRGELERPEGLTADRVTESLRTAFVSCLEKQAPAKTSISPAAPVLARLIR